MHPNRPRKGIPGVDAMTAVTVLAAVGDFHRFGSADKLVSYLGLNPRVRQSGGTRPPRPDHEGRLWQGPRDAGAGRVRRAALPGPAAGPAPADSGPARDADRDRRGRPEDRRHRLAPGHQGTGLRFRPPELGRLQTPQARADRRRRTPDRPPRGGLRLQQQATAPPRTRDRRASRTRLRSADRPMAAHAPDRQAPPARRSRRRPVTCPP
ncbi:MULTISPECIES: IS110 family transposase [unclassified Streptomyces]|uniref:IS110 family transposase n=1 Tax=unclassified Streptomyces TaxID=2593676 RepID=UPI003D909B66